MPKTRGPSPLDNADGTRDCIACGTRYPLEQYDRDKAAALGRRARCKPCRSQQMKDWYAANRERQAQRQRDRFEANREAIREQDIARYYRHREKRIALVTEAGNRRRALMRELPADRGITVAALRKRDGDNCCYCGCLMTFVPGPYGAPRIPTRATIEHRVAVTQGGGHTWDNVALACWSCNARKNATPLDEWLAKKAQVRGLQLADPGGDPSLRA